MANIKMILNKKKLSFNSTTLINSAFCFFPISFIFGNLITNINFLLFCCLGLFYLKSKIFVNKLHFSMKLIFLFFLLVFFSTSLNLIESLYFGDYEKSDFFRLVKSILFFRFFIILLIIYILSELNIINFKYFFLLATLLPIFISIDVIFQYFFGFNFIGIKSYGHHNTSFFGDELIAGGYIQNFSFFSILLLTYLTRNYGTVLKIILTTTLTCVLAIGIILSGNKMPFALFLFGLLLLFIFNKESRKIVLISYFMIFIIFGFIRSFDYNIKYSYYSFYEGIKKTSISLSQQINNNLLKINLKEDKKLEEKQGLEKFPYGESFNDPEADGYKKLIYTAIETWKPNKLFGNGIKSFRFECQKIVAVEKSALCSNHPHNYYLEILIDLGILGFVLVMVIALMFMAFLVKNYKALKKKNNLQSLFLLAAIISIFLEVFPFKSSGSIFTTNNTTYLILISSIVFSYKQLLKGRNFE